MFNAVTMNMPGSGIEPENAANLAGTTMCMDEQYVIPSGSMGADYGMPQFGGLGGGQQSGMDNSIGGMFMMFGMIMQGLMLMLAMVTTMLQLKNSAPPPGVNQPTDTHASHSTDNASDGGGDRVDNHHTHEPTDTDTETDTDNDTDTDHDPVRGGDNDEETDPAGETGDEDVDLDDPRVESVRSDRGNATERTANWGALH